MSLIASMNLIDRPLAEAFTASTNEVLPENRGFSGLFSAMVTEQSLAQTTMTSSQNLLDTSVGRDTLTSNLVLLSPQNEPQNEVLGLSMIASPVVLETEHKELVVSNFSNEISSPPLIDTLEPLTLDVLSTYQSMISGEPKNDLVSPVDKYTGKVTPLSESDIVTRLPEIDGVQSGLLELNIVNQTIGQNGATGINQSGQLLSNQPVNAHSVSWGAQSSSAFEQSGQSTQNGAGQSHQQQTQQQSMMFAQLNQESKQQSLAQQAAVRAMDDAIIKSEGRELLGGAEIASLDRKSTLPLGLQTIHLPVKHPQWGQALGQRIVFMSNNSLQQAQITLNPQSLGQIQVTLQLDKDQQMHVSLMAQNGMTREAMESALPKLREMMEQAGVNLSSVNIRDQKSSSGHKDDAPSQQKQTSENNLMVEESSSEGRVSSTFISTNNIVDYYA